MTHIIDLSYVGDSPSHRIFKMAIQSDLLTTAAAKPASIVRRLTAVFAPLMLIGLLLFYGILPAVLQQARIATSQPLKLFSLWAWRDAILGASMPILLDSSDKNWAPVKEALLREAQGDILEVGAGSGATVRYYDAQSVSDEKRAHIGALWSGALAGA